MKVPDGAVCVFEKYDAKIMGASDGRFYEVDEDGNCSHAGPSLDDMKESLERLEMFWQGHIAHRDDEASVRIGGQHYRIGDENDKGYFRGFGGARYRIKFHDGREVVSTNLWGQGKVPNRHREALPDNAEFLK